MLITITMIKNWKWSILSVMMMGILFISSHTPYQQQDMKPFFKDYVTLSQEDLPQVEFTYDGSLVTPSEPYQYVEFFIRKAAHVVSFGLLTLLCVMAFKERGRHPSLLLGSLSGFGYALFDEFHQSLVKGRTGHLIDVFIPDTLGILLAALLYMIVNRFHLKKSR
ncbi:VanZ family protein [Alkalihalobacillus macyae]|uniref:VanZ family protein n=1 Tax=Guptibacillus hwajinpoensis TaxID=208199 RepID=UPI00273ADD12|nr:VanZ family protein [Alkalihalobacillus macyae]MDP4552096.1 VanZ family protein [Alkalihalobacillus macyae]